MPKRSAKLGENFLKLDGYAEPVRLHYNGGMVNFRTRVGSVITLLELACVLMFAINRILVMNAKDNPTVTSYLDLPPTGVYFGESTNLTFAYGISTFAGGVEADQDDYVSISAQYTTWNQTTNFTNTPLLVRHCTPADFGLDGPVAADSKFFPASPAMVETFNSKLSSLHCLN